MTPEAVYTLLGQSVGAGLVLGGFVALFNSWRV